MIDEKTFPYLHDYFYGPRHAHGIAHHKHAGLPHLQKTMDFIYVTPNGIMAYGIATYSDNS